MKQTKAGAKIIAVIMLFMLMILLTGCNGAKEASISTSSAVAEATETAKPLSVVGITEHVEGRVYTFDKDSLMCSECGQTADVRFWKTMKID